MPEPTQTDIINAEKRRELKLLRCTKIIEELCGELAGLPTHRLWQFANDLRIEINMAYKECVNP